jgi:hypothetical protein
MTQSNLLFAGIPHTGKTTFLALLSLAITMNKRSSIKLGHFQDDREYLTQVAQRLFSCDEADRTEVGHSNGMGLSIVLPSGDETYLTIPDLSGETWHDLLTDRTWTQDLQDTVEAASGICIFVHAAEFLPDLTLAEVDRIASALGEDDSDAGDDANLMYADPRFQSAQVQLVDLLQLLGDQFAPTARHISLIISAFDTVAGQTPTDWLKENAPLVSQYLDSNTAGVVVQTFGLSAQGGRFDDAEARVALLNRDPLDRAFVVRGNGAAADLDAPVMWAMNGV